MNKNPLSPKAVNKAVLANSLQHPLVLYPAVAGALAAVSTVAFHLGSAPLILAAGGAVTAVGGWLYQFIARRENYSQAYFSEIQVRLNREKMHKLSKLRKELIQVESFNGIKQLELLDVKYRNFEEILGSKLEPTEMTYSRYLSIAEQVYLAVLDNLDKVFLTLKSISAVDKEHLAHRLKALENDQSALAEKEKETLTRRQLLHQQQLDRSADMILANERALTELDEVTAKIASVQMNKGRADLDLDIAMEELRRLAERSDKYAR
jgi:phage repressor protein C with HTH and peptisase S24 domain